MQNNGRFHTSILDCVILAITITSCICLVAENGLRGNSQKMSQKIIAYLRTSTDKQDLNNQKLEILE